MTLSINMLLKNATSSLTQVTDAPSLEAEVLLAFVLKQSRSYLHAWSQKNVTDLQCQDFNALLIRRLQKEPIAYLTRHREFWSLPLEVSQATLIPRPETERLVEIILSLSAKKGTCEVADLGTGCGALALALAHERPNWHLHATDISEPALLLAKKNAQRLGLQRISFSAGDWCDALPHNQFDVIASNPPYIAQTEWAAYANELAYEPKEALVSGRDGLEAIRQISRSAKHYLKLNGYLVLEHGYLQGALVRELFAKEGYQQIVSFEDLSGHERITAGYCFSTP